MRYFLTCFILLALISCRTDRPPALSLICTLDGFGAGDCITSDGTRKYLSPSEMKDMWATTQTDEANFAAWCYRTSPKTTYRALEQLKQSIALERVQ